MNLINSKIRFALDPSNGQLYDYFQQRYLEPVGVIQDGTGIWYLEEVKKLIERGLHIEDAHRHTSQLEIAEPAPPVDNDHVAEGATKFDTPPVVKEIRLPPEGTSVTADASLTLQNQESGSDAPHN